MFDQLHFSHQIRRFNQICMGVAPGEHHMGHGRFFIAQKGDDLLDIKVIITQSDIDLIQQHHVIALITDQLFGFGPSGLGHFGIAGFVLGFPSEPLSHGMKRAEIVEMLQDQIPFACAHSAFDELNHGTFALMGNMAKNHVEGRGGFALSLTGMNDHQAFFVGFGCHDLVPRGFFLGHFHGMAINIFTHGGLL